MLNGAWFRGLGLVIVLTFWGPLLWVLAAGPCAAETPEGREIAQRIFDRDVGRDSSVEATMTLISAGGQEKERRFQGIFKTDGPRRRALIRFLSPADIQGTGFLVLEKEAGETEQFLYLPALKRARRIVASQKSMSFVNSDFTYEDMERRPVDDSQHRLVGEESVNGIPCWILESTPLDKSPSQYGMVRTWAAKDCFVPLRTHYFDKKGRHIKTYEVRKLEQIQGIRTETEVLMHNLHDDHKTVIKSLSVAYNTGLSDEAFTVRALESD